MKVMGKRRSKIQDIYSTIYVSNLSEDIILETQQELFLESMQMTKIIFIMKKTG